MKLTIVSSSIRADRRTHKVAQVLFNLAIEKNINARLVDLKSVDLPEYGKPLNEQQSETKSKLDKQLADSESFIFVTPEYNGFFSSALKSFVDYFSNGPFKNKKIGTATVTSGPIGGIRAAQMLQIQILGLFGLPLPNMLLTGLVDNKINDDYEVTDLDYLSKADSFLDQLTV
jgi:NAD(P)H-dependent FMN reductase